MHPKLKLDLGMNNMMHDAALHAKYVASSQAAF